MSELRDRLREAVDTFAQDLVFTAPEAWGERIAQLRDRLDDIADDLAADAARTVAVRDELIDSLQQLLACYRAQRTPSGSLLDRIGDLRIEHEKLRQAG